MGEANGRLEKEMAQALLEAYDEKIENIRDEQETESHNFKYIGVIQNYNRLSVLTSEITLVHDGMTEILKTNVPALVWKRHLHKEVMILGKRGSTEEEVVEIITVRMMLYEQELHEFFPREEVFEHYANMLNQLTEDKLRHLQECYSSMDTMSHEVVKVREQFVSIEELKLKYAILRKTYPKNIRMEIERDFAEYEHVGKTDKIVLRNILFILVNYLFQANTYGSKSVSEVRTGLDESHVGANSIKNFLVKEYQAFLQDKERRAPKCILLVGPSGSGTTSILQSFAKSADMLCETINLAGMNDTIELVGSSRGYENSSSGDFLKRLFRVENGMIILEKIDRLKDADCINILMKIINGTYENKMLEVGLDVSNVWFVATATDTSRIPQSTLDLMTTIHMEDYSREEIMKIGFNAVIRNMERYPVNPHFIMFSNDAIAEVAFRYSRKNSIRNIVDNINDVFKNILMENDTVINITKDNLQDYFSLAKNREVIRNTYACEWMEINKKAIVCQEEYTEDVNKRILKLLEAYEGSGDEEKAYILEALKQLVNTLPKRDLVIDLNEVERKLDSCLYGLRGPKEKILDQLAAYTINPEVSFKPIILAGGPGIGKTSLARRLAMVLNRPFVEINMNEVWGGERFTGMHHMVKGSSSGLFKDLSEEGVCSYDAVVFLDEFEKMLGNNKGNSHEVFHNLFDKTRRYYDNWLEVFYSTSRIMFILAVNKKELVPETILDRCIVIDLDGYGMKEKVHIAKQYVIPKVLSNYKCEGKIDFSENAVRLIVKKYAISEGVRDIERSVESIIERILRKHLKNYLSDERFYICVDEDRVTEYLGEPLYCEGDISSDNEDLYGTAHALAVAGNSGCVFQVECDYNPYGADLEITGLAKDSMLESIKLARIIAEKMIQKEIKKVHFHATCAGVEKSGPSAGVTAWAALMSLVLQKSLGNVSMSGELTLRGQIRGVGGVKEKIIAAERAGIKTVYLPTDNWRRLCDAGEIEKFDTEIIPVSTVFELAKYLFPDTKFDADTFSKNCPV